MSSVAFEEPASSALGAPENVEEYGYETTDDIARDDQDVRDSGRSAKRRGVVTAEETFFEISYHPGRVKFYSPPRQRQRWGESQVLPRTNWGDIFFDLFYVAATYNVSYIFVKDTSVEGLLYGAGTFLPVMGIWLTKMSYDARFVYEDDIFHRLILIGQLTILAYAVLNIRPVKYMSNPEESNTMFAFSNMLLAERILSLILALEIYFFGVGQKEVLKKTSLTMTGQILIPAVFYAAAAILAGIKFFGETDHGIDDDHHRFLAADDKDANYDESDQSSHTDIPMLLVLAGYVLAQGYISIRVIFFYPSGGRHKENTVPANISFMMHRYGEWIMLMLGESVFSLLIVYVSNKGSGFYQTFYCGILTVMLLQYLHFKSEPESPDRHAARRSKNAAIGWLALTQIYSLALVALGAAYTVFLMSFADDERRRLENAARELAGGETISEEMLEDAAGGFCASLAVVFLSLDLMTLCHVGFKEGHNRCVCKSSKKKNVKGIILIFLRTALILVAFTLSNWVQDPETLSLSGLFFVLAQLVLRKLGGMYLGHNQVHAMESSEAH